MIIYKKTVRKNGIDFEKSRHVNFFIGVACLLVVAFLPFILLLDVALVILMVVEFIGVVFAYYFGFSAAFDAGEVIALQRQKSTRKTRRKRRS